MNYGLKIMSTSFIAIILTAPIGVVLVNSLGEKWLTYDGEETKKISINKKDK